MESYALAGLQNGDFSLGLDGWDYDVVTIVGGVAVMGEDPDWLAYLEQEFTIIPDHAVSLSFEYKPSFEALGSESFTASLLDATSSLPLVSSTTEYFAHDWYDDSDDSFDVDEVTMDSAVTVADLGVGWTEVTLDLTSLSGATPTQVLLAFDYLGFDVSYGGKIEIDNVTYVPVPGAVVLGAIGLSFTGWRLRRRRTS